MPRLKDRRGVPVDRHGAPAIDPTANVLALVGAETKRQDDLRDADRRLSELRAAHATELRELESKRLDAVRQVDISAVNTAADRQLAAIQALAATTAATAETLRAMVSDTAATMATQTSATMATVNERIAALERTQYKGEGKGAGVGMVWAILLAVISALAGVVGIGGVLYAVLSK